MNLLDAALCLALAARIHNDHEKVRATAWRVIGKVPYAQRGAIALIIKSKEPLAVVAAMLEAL